MKNAETAIYSRRGGVKSLTNGEWRGGGGAGGGRAKIF